MASNVLRMSWSGSASFACDCSERNSRLNLPRLAEVFLPVAAWSSGALASSALRTASVQGSRIVSATLSPISMGFCGRYATFLRHCCSENDELSAPSSVNVPSAWGLSSAKAVSRLLLPEPDGPTRSTIWPRSTSNDRSSKMVRSDCAEGTTQETLRAVNNICIVATLPVRRP